ncbi:hypothetical protein BDW69DRAFT_188227 [Aspergillus filifer]
MAKLTREGAREVISKLYDKSGAFLANDERERAIAAVLGAPVLAAAARAWTADMRFIYELVQNADDASYNCVSSKEEDPEVKFYVYPDRIVVESNEDGFDKSDVQAICTAGGSTKTGQIGEKGIGFKSVFRVAHKVIIQSGPFCFSLQHRAGDNGLGMIAPVSEAHEVSNDDSLTPMRTRITLFTLEPELYARIRSTVRKIPPSTFAFLSKIKAVRFEFYDPVLSMEFVNFQQDFEGTSSSCSKFKRDEVEINNFYCFKKQVLGLPARESRPSPEKVEIVLAFPRDNQVQLNTQPSAYAYLPLRGVGLNFLVQADFVTLDNREDLASCPWNDHLLGNLPHVFYAALKELCHKSDFETVWPRFLPLKELKIPHWSQFRTSVLRDFKYFRFFRTRRGTMKSLSEIRYLLQEHCDRNGDPLFDDLEEDIYLSSQYAEFYDSLIPFGLQPISSHQLLDRFRPYLTGPQPRLLHKRRFDRDWSDRVTLLLLSWMDSSLDTVAEELKKLPLVVVDVPRELFSPSSEALRSPSSSDIFFPFDSSGNKIPDFILELVLCEMGTSRQQLFSRLGVKRAKPSFVLDTIHRLNKNDLGPPNVSQSIRNLNHGKKIETTHLGSNNEIRKQEVYFDSFDNRLASAVLRKIEKRVAACGQPPLQIRFLHPDYTPLFQSGPSWVKWLEQVGSIRRAPRLETRDSLPPQPSDTLLSIIKYAPEDLISILQMHSETYSEELTSASASTVSAIRKAFVPVECGKVSLEKSFLGTLEQRALWSGVHLQRKFPFLSIPDPLWSVNLTKWEFLRQFGVTTTTTTDFLIASAKALSCIFPRRNAKDAFFRLYGMLTVESFEELCAQMSDAGFIYIPLLGTDDRLAKPSDCLWDGDVSGTKHVLASHDVYTRTSKVKQLFKTVLTSQGAEWVTKLSHLRTKTMVSLTSVCDVYKAIMEDTENGSDWYSIRKEFEHANYIYVPHEDSWYPPSLCVWSGLSWIDGRCGIRGHYADLRYLFVQKLGVFQPDIPSYIEQILAMVQAGTIDSTDWLLVMQELNDLNPNAVDLEPLRLVKFLPVRRKDTQITYVAVDASFFIVDDPRLQLDREVPILAITPEGACRLRHTLTALGLGRHYVSMQIRESTCLINDAKESTELTHEFRQKADALCRCTIYYGSRKSLLSSEQIRTIFSQTTVFTATGFRRHFRLDDGLATEETHGGRLSFVGNNEAFQIYVPSDRKQRAICYATELPHALVSYLKINHQAACGTFATILRESPDLLDDILEEKGIIYPMPSLSNKLPIRLKNQFASKSSNIDFRSSSTFTQAHDRSTVIKLKANNEYLEGLCFENQISGLGYLTALTKKYGIGTEYLDVNDLSTTLSEYFKVTPEHRGLTFTEAALKVAAESQRSDQMALLLDDLATQSLVVTIPPPVLEAAAANEICGDEIMRLLCGFSKSCRQSLDVTDAVLEVAAENEALGPTIMVILFQLLEDQRKAIRITDSVLKAAAQNTESGDALVALLLGRRHQSGWKNEDIALTAVRNEDFGRQIISLLLEGPGEISVSQELLHAAAENLHQGAGIMALLLAKKHGDIQVTEGIIISAVHNKESGLDILTLLSNAANDHFEVTERIMLAAAESEDCMKIIDLLSGIHQGNLPISNAVLETAATNGASTRQELFRLQDLSDSQRQIIEVFPNTPIDLPRNVTLLLRDQGRITENVMVAAAASKDYGSGGVFSYLLSEPHDPVTDAVFNAAVGNSPFGYDFVYSLLASSADYVHISENSLLAASENPVCGPGILDLLLKRWPDVPITENVVLAAANTNSTAAEKLIQHIHGSPTKPNIEITEALVEALSRNRDCGARALLLLLDTQVEDKSALPVTQAALVNAAGNIGCGYEIMSLLLDHGGKSLKGLMTEDVTIAAAGNFLWGLEILAFLHDHEYPIAFSMRVLAAAERNIWSGEEIVAFLLRHHDTETDDVVRDSIEDVDLEEGDNWFASREIPELEQSDMSGDDYETADNG